MTGRKTECLTSVDNIFSETDSYFCHSVFDCLIAYGIIIKRTPYSAERRIIEALMIFADNFLNDNSHFLLIYDIGGRGHIGFAVVEENRSIDALYSIGKHLNHNLAVFDLRYHIGRINAGKRLVVAVFKKG